MRLLVVGASRVDAGKTTFSTGLIAHTGAVGFKPRAGNDYWFHHDDYWRAIDRGRLYGADARRLAAAGPGDVEPADINPVHRLWRPSPGTTGFLGQDDRTFLVDRVGDRYVVNGTADVPQSARDRLPLSGAVAVESVEELNRAIERLHVPAMESLSATIASTDRAVVESYGDVARPMRGIDPGAVAVVEPGRARLVDGDRYVRACGITAGGPSPGEGQLEERVGSVIDLLDPVETVSLPALESDTRAEPAAVADAYADAYAELLSIADW
jgi:predicted P-loop ATPase/GTPase